MRAPLTIAFLRLARTGTIEAHARELGVLLEQLGKCVTRCHMTLEGRTSHGRTLYIAKIELSLPSAQIFADSLYAEPVGHQDIHLALQDAYYNAARQLHGFHRNRSKQPSGAQVPTRHPDAGAVTATQP
jgi:hypothetical protein